MNVGVFKLKSGTELIAAYDDTETGWLIKKPMVLVQMMGPNGVPQMTLKPWAVLFVLEELEIDASDVFIVGTPPPSVETAYIEVTTGLAVPEKPSIITSGR